MSLKEGLKKSWKKFWFLLWKDDSLKGWVFSVVFLFIFIKFIFFPFLSLVTGTALPLAIVESCSMYHKGNLFSDLDKWWENHEEKYEEYVINDLDWKYFSFKNGFNKGDILFIIKANPETLEIGDVIIFNANQKNPIIHRIINVREVDGEKIFSTIGDNNNGQLVFEKNILEDQMVGKAVLKLAPYVGWVKLVFYDWNKPGSEKGLCEER
jgi:signal peptidase I